MMAEAAVLSVIAIEVSRRGLCRLTIGQIAGQAGVCKQTVRNAVREAAGQGLFCLDHVNVGRDHGKVAGICCAQQGARRGPEHLRLEPERMCIGPRDREAVQNGHLEFSPPQPFEPPSRGPRVADGVLRVAVSEVVLDEPKTISAVREREPARVAQHMRVDRRQAGVGRSLGQ